MGAESHAKDAEQAKEAAEAQANKAATDAKTALEQAQAKEEQAQEKSKTYMTKQYGTEEFNTNIAADPFVQAELKTLLNDTTEPGNAEAIQEAHKKVIARHYNTLYPNVTGDDIMSMNSPDIKDHIVIPPYLYLSLTDYFVVFSVTNDDANKKNIKMRFLDSDGKNSDNNEKLLLEKGFHIIIKKLGNGTDDFFSRIDVKFVLLNTPQNASEIIKVFDISTFYGHIPTQTILSIDESST